MDETTPRRGTDARHADIRRLLDETQSADPSRARAASEELLPLVYEELRRLAASRMARLAPGQTIQPTALVHEAYLQVARDPDRRWEGRRHFFGAAARAMRDILVDHARRRGARKRGGDRDRLDVDDAAIQTPNMRLSAPTEDMLALDEALAKLERDDPPKAEIVMLRYFAGLSVDETAAALGTSSSSIDRAWRYIVARLHRDLDGERRD